jgi:nuclear pore complex protein Nup85
LLFTDIVISDFFQFINLDFFDFHYFIQFKKTTIFLQVGVLYFDTCPIQGRHRLELLLERIPLSSDKKAEKVLNIANERGLTLVCTSTCKIMGMKALKSGQIGNAMTWGLRSQDAAFTTFLADKLLKLYCESGNFTSGDLLDHLG